MDDNWSEPEIIRGLQKGSSNAWAALCSLYSERLWRYVSRLIGSNEAAVADVFQETLLAVAKSGRSLREGSHLWAWLSTIGHNQSALYWRQQSRRTTGSLNGEDVIASEPEDLLQRQETIADVRWLLSEMSAEYVTVLTAKYSEGLSSHEIAEQLGEGTEAVRSRLARARRDFRQRYEARCREAPGLTAAEVLAGRQNTESGP